MAAAGPRQRRTRLLAVAAAVAATQLPGAAGIVDCGGHFAELCKACPDGNGAEWCNGDCQWEKPFLSSKPGFCKPALKLPFDLGGLIRLARDNYWWYFCGFGASAAIMLVFAAAYNTQVVQAMPRVPSAYRVGSRAGILACLSSPHTCLHTFLCMPVVAGKNYQVTEVMGFWPGCIFTFLSTYSPLYCLMAFVRAILSMKVQQRVGHPTGFMEACCANLFCMPCDVGRESLEVDGEVGAEVTCCCNLSLRGQPINAGQPQPAGWPGMQAAPPTGQGFVAGKLYTY